jgi:hypothetical protein
MKGLYFAMWRQQIGERSETPAVAELERAMTSGR